MPTNECHALAASERVARLGCCKDNQPYVVPIHHVYAEGRIFSFSMSGRKIDYMRSNPHVCLEIERCYENRHWQSVIIVGTFNELSKTEEGERAWEILKVYNDWWEHGALEIAPHYDDTQHAPIYFAISINEMTGREATPQ